MGLTFRDGTYTRRVKFGKRTVKEGEAAVIWNRNGRCREIVGPSLERMWYSTIKFMHRHTAKPGQYVVIHHKNGRIEHIPGPFAIYQNPTNHGNVEVKEGVQLTTPSDCVVVVSHGATAADRLPQYDAAAAAPAPPAKALGGAAPAGGGCSEGIDRQVVRGPAQFIPRVNDQVVTLSWSIDPADGAGHELSHTARGKLCTFEVLTLRPFRMPVKAPLKTADGITLELRLDFGVQISDVELAIANPDPIDALWTALQSDLARMGPKLPADAVLRQLEPARIGVTATYESMMSKATATGVTVLDVQVKSIEMPAELKRAHEARLAADAQHEAAMAKARRSAEVEHATAEARLQRAAQNERVAASEFAASVREVENDHKLNAAKHSHALELEASRLEARLVASRAEHTVLAGFLGQLKAVDVDLTTYLSSMAPLPGAFDPRGQVNHAAGLDQSTPSAMATASAAAAAGGRSTGSGKGGGGQAHPTVRSRALPSKTGG